MPKPTMCVQSGLVEPPPAPVARPRRRARAQQEPPEPPTEAFEPEPGESYEAALQRLLGDESAERFAARVAELADQEPADAAATRQPKPEPAKPEPWWAPWLAWWRERH